MLYLLEEGDCPDIGYVVGGEPEDQLGDVLVVCEHVGNRDDNRVVEVIIPEVDFEFGLDVLDSGEKSSEWIAIALLAQVDRVVPGKFTT